MDFKKYLLKNLGTLMHEIAHAIYAKQTSSLQYRIERFFLQYPSPYSPFAYCYLNEAIATALGNGIFMEQLTGYKEINYDNDYINECAYAIYNDVKQYLVVPEELYNYLLISIKMFKFVL